MLYFRRTESGNLMAVTCVGCGSAAAAAGAGAVTGGTGGAVISATLELVVDWVFAIESVAETAGSACAETVFD